jgi:Holliday junction resolvase
VPNRNYLRGYRLEYKVRLILEYNGWHVTRKHASKGIEDLIAIKKGKQPLFIQCKDTKLGDKSMSVHELEVFRLHSVEYGAAPIFCYKKNQKIFYKDVEQYKFLNFKPYTQKWIEDRRKYKDHLHEEKSGTKRLQIIIKSFRKLGHIICY